ncbi:MAG: hypothetical protein KAT70_00575, partial [Thermoplasmata archaeon]|nr:hypothetical protein [Thermoplasmata archaeon]
WKTIWGAFAFNEYTTNNNTNDADFDQLIENCLAWAGSKASGPPALSNASVTPSEGPESGVYNYTVTWTDPDDDWPTGDMRLVVEVGDVLEEKFTLETIASPPTPSATGYAATTAIWHDVVDMSAAGPGAIDSSDPIPLSDIAADDGTRYISADPGNPDESWIEVTMVIAEDAADIDSIDLLMNIQGNAATDFQVWVEQDGGGTWDYIGTVTAPADTDVDAIGQITDASIYLSGAGDTLHWGVYQTDSSDLVRVDYVHADANVLVGGDLTSTGVEYYYELPAAYFNGRLGDHTFQIEAPGDGLFPAGGDIGVKNGPFIWDTSDPVVSVDAPFWIEQYTGEVMAINATVTDAGAGVGMVWLHYRNVGQNWPGSTVLMHWAGNMSNPDQYTANIPVQASTGTVYYYVEAYDTNTTANAATDPATSPEANAYTIDIIALGGATLSGGITDQGETWSGWVGDSITFDAQYAHVTGIVADFVQVTVDNGVTWYDLVDQGTGGWITGRDFSLTTTPAAIGLLAGDSVNYRFQARYNEGGQQWATGDILDHGPITVYTDPTLSSGYVTAPGTTDDSGAPGDTFTMGVTWTQLNDLSPTQIQVWTEWHAAWQNMIFASGTNPLGAVYTWDWDTTAVPDGAYQYKFRAERNGHLATGQYDTWIGTITLVTGVLEPPTDVTASMSTDGTTMTLTWTDSLTAGVTGYIFLRDTDPAFPAPTILCDVTPILPAVQTYDDTGVDDNVEYYYQVGVRKAGDVFNTTVLAKSVITMGAGLNLIGMDLPIDLIRPDGGFGPEGCKNATLEIQTQNAGVNVLVIRQWTPGGWVKYEPSEEPFTSYFNMYAKEGYFIQVSADPLNEWRVGGLVFESPQTITLGSGLNLVSPPTDLVRPDGGFGPEGCKNASSEIVAQNPAISVIMIRKYTTGGWVKYEPSQEPFTSYFNMDADRGYFIQVSADPPNEWETSW